MKIRLMNGVLSIKKKKNGYRSFVVPSSESWYGCRSNRPVRVSFDNTEFYYSTSIIQIFLLFQINRWTIFFFFIILSSTLLTTLLSSRKISILLMHQVLEELVLQNTYSRLPILWAHKITIVNCIWHQNTRLYIIHVFKIPTQCRRMPLSWTTRESCYV